ncbi:hypothetical protein APSETT445_009050 [Aspergillus pseudonomiae]
MPPSVIQAVNQLGWNLITHLCVKRDSSAAIAVSPLAITIALGMLAGGADKARCKEFCEKLGLDDPEELIPVLSTIQDTLTGAFDRRRRFTTANAMFADSSTDIAPTYVEYLRCFGAHLDHSFARLEDGTNCMNAWVSEHTNGLIPCMLNSRTLAHANIVLVNALVFKAAWQERFDRKNTLKEFPFHVSSHRTCPVEMMLLHRHEILIWRNRTYTAVRLPYTSSASSQLAFIAYLPTDASSLLHTLQALRRDGPPRRFEPTKLLQFGLPKFNLRVQEGIVESLCDLAYPISGTFPGISAGVMVQHIIHSVAILLDEDGTESAAATAVVTGRGGRPTYLPSVVFDRPFVFSIVAEDMDLVLFTGIFTVG